MIYGIAENPWPTGKCVKYTPRRLGVKVILNFHVLNIVPGAIHSATIVVAVTFCARVELRYS